VIIEMLALRSAAALAELLAAIGPPPRFPEPLLAQSARFTRDLGGFALAPAREPDPRR
jgi:hypothetical protein